MSATTAYTLAEQKVVEPALPAAPGPQPARSLLHKTGWSTVATAALVIARFVVTIFTTRYLGPQGAGRLAYLLWIQEIVATIVGFGMVSCMTRFAAELTGMGREDAVQGLARWLYIPYLALTVLGGTGVALVAVQSWRPVSDSLTWLTLAFCLIFQSMGAFYLAYLAGRQRFDRIAAVNLASGAVLIMCSALGVVLWGVRGVLLGYVAGSALPALLSCGLLRVTVGTVSPDRGLASRCLKYSGFAWCGAVVSACIWSRIEVIFLERYWGNREVAMFSVGLTLSALAIQAPMLLSSALMPHFAESAGTGDSLADSRVYACATRLLAALLFPLCLGTSSLIPVMLPMLYGEAFRPAVPCAMVLTAFSLLSLMNVGSALVYAIGKAWFIAASGFAGSILSLAACAAVIPAWGAWGACLSRSAVQTAMAVLGTWYIHRYLSCPAPLASLGKILLASVSAAAVSYATAAPLANLPAVALSIGLAALVYIAILRGTRALDPDDIRALRAAANRMPGPMIAPISNVLGWLL